MTRCLRPLAVAVALFGSLTGSGTARADDAKPAGARLNVLMIAVDDWRPQGGCYGDPVVKTPNLDRLAARGVVFRRAYCQQAVCSPSRTSLLTGRRPDTTRVYDLDTHFRTTIPDVVTLPQHFKAAGHHTQGLSKIYHGGLDDPPSWTVPHWTPRAPGYGPEGQALVRRLTTTAKTRGVDVQNWRKAPRGWPTEDPDVADEELADGQTAAKAIEVLREIKDRPFFLAVGFLKPHLPFVAPKKYWDLYRPEDVRLAANPYPPAGAPKFAGSDSGELRQYQGMPKQGPLSEEQARRLVHGYYAATSFMDAQVGKVLDELDRLDLADRTIVLAWGDHGWKLGEHGMWCKHTNYENDANAPLIVAAPGRKAVGAKSDALVEFVDIYPTLAELCGLPTPEGLEGTSFAPLLDDPDRPWKTAAFGQYPRGGGPGVGPLMGYAMRTNRYRFVEWKKNPGGNVVARELYDHQVDAAENVNIADRPENAELVRSLSQQAKAGWRAAKPPTP
jgi:arylsulfatase A-like enzyme